MVERNLSPFFPPPFSLLYMHSIQIDIFDKTYELCDQIQFRDYERASYEEICAEVFPGLTFEKWYQAGYWSDLFNPHVLKDGDKIVSAISVNKMDIRIGSSEPRLYIQLGGVMTSKSYRNQGLSTTLMDKILTDYEDKCDGFYLVASEDAKGFYPRFGFKAVDEHQYYLDIKSDISDNKAFRLNMNTKTDVDLLIEHFKLGNPFSLINIQNLGLLMFYCMKYNKNDVYYIEEEDAIAIAGYENEVIVLYDIFCKPDSSFENILASITRDNTEKIYFGFPLIKTKHCKLTKCKEEDNILFVLDKSESSNLADFLHIPEYSNKLMMPLLMHA